MLNPDGISSALPLCKCGCGEQVKLTREGRPNSYIRGHVRRGKALSQSHKDALSRSMKGKPGHWLGKKMSVESREKMSVAKKGRTMSMEQRMKISKTMTGKPHPSIPHKQTLETRLKQSAAQKGEKSWNWQGGLSTEEQRARHSMYAKDWRLAVFKRDNYTCRHCGARTEKGSGVQLHAHHIVSFSKNEDLRFEVSNGLTLCQNCHRAEHKRIKEDAKQAQDIPIQ